MSTVRAAAVAAVLLIAAVLGAAYVRESRIRQERSPYQALQARWEDAFHRDAQSAYADFLKTGTALSYDDAHKLAHIVGTILYEDFGIGGIARCTPDFAFGCYHGFAGAVLSEQGLAVADKLRAACDEAGDASISFGCIHGIGHGILSFLGNSELTKALRACVPINEGSEIAGCYGGVFMEYNFNTMQSQNGISLRPFDVAHAYEPCASEVPQEFRAACYYEQASWWHASLGGNDSALERYREVGLLCAGIGEAALRDMCFRGIGNVIGPESGYAPSIMRQWCATMPTAAAQGICFHEALQHLLQRPDGRAELRALCSAGTITYANLCDRP